LEIAAMTVTRGRCLCGEIKYEFDGKPKWVGYCHCESCRRQTSSLVAAYLGVKVDQFDYLEGTPATFESSPGVWRYFCGKCGSPMAFTDDQRFPGEVHLFIGSLEHPEAFKPTLHGYCDEKIPWFEVHDDLPRYGKLAGKGVTPLRRGPEAK
jgi:hypothetical protein